MNIYLFVIMVGVVGVFILLQVSMNREESENFQKIRTFIFENRKIHLEIIRNALSTYHILVKGSYTPEDAKLFTWQEKYAVVFQKWPSFFY